MQQGCFPLGKSDQPIFYSFFRWRASFIWSALRGGLGTGLAGTSLDFWHAESNTLFIIFFFFGTEYNFPIPFEVQREWWDQGVKIKSVE